MTDTDKLEGVSERANEHLNPLFQTVTDSSVKTRTLRSKPEPERAVPALARAEFKKTLNVTS